MKLSLTEKLQELMVERGISSYRLAKDSGVPYTTLKKILDGTTKNPQLDSLEAIAGYFGKSIDEIATGKSNTINPTKNFEVDSTIVEMVQIPIYGEIRAGYNSLAQQDILGYEIVAKDAVSSGEYFFLIVKGDSMVDEGIREGMRVLVRKQQTCQHGKIGVVIVNGDEGTLKRVFFDGDNVILQAANKDIPPKVLPIEDVAIQGQVTKVEFDV